MRSSFVRLTVLIGTFTAPYLFNPVFAQNTSAEVEKVIADFTEKGFTGNILIAKDDSVLKTFSRGYTNKKETIEIADSTLFNIASVTKGITAVAIMQLRDKKLLHIDDPINKYLSNIPVNALGITIHHLLVHQSGLANNYAADGEEDVNAAVTKIFSSPLKNMPGEKFLYSNTNYSLLAMIIEKIAQSS